MGAAYRNRTDDLRITSLSSTVLGMLRLPLRRVRQIAASGGYWLLTAVRGHLGGTIGGWETQLGRSLAGSEIQHGSAVRSVREKAAGDASLPACGMLSIAALASADDPPDAHYLRAPCRPARFCLPGAGHGLSAPPPGRDHHRRDHRGQSHRHPRWRSATQPIKPSRLSELKLRLPACNPPVLLIGAEPGERSAGRGARSDRMRRRRRPWPGGRDRDTGPPRKMAGLRHHGA